MSDANIVKPEPESQASEGVIPSEFVPEVTFNRSKGELSLVLPGGKTFSMKVNEVDDDDEPERKPLTPEEFREALTAIDKLGLTWTADMVPDLKAKTVEAEAALAGEELEALQGKYPHLPYEIHLAVTYALTGNKAGADAAGGLEWFDKKAETVNEVLIDNDYRSEFFFKYAIKIPYLKDIDWEVVFKVYERGITKPLGIPYGVLTLTLQDPFFTGRGSGARKTTVAVDMALVNELLTILNEVKSNLESAKHLRDKLSEQHLLEEQDNANPKPQLEQ